MIEVIYKDESQETQNGEEPFGLPRNIRQIGAVGDDYKIYMEDYVYTFLVRLARSENASGEQKAQAAVLVGETKWRSQTAYLFIKGAVMAENMDAAPDHIDFSGEQWKQIQEDQKKYFEDQEVVGWFFSQPQLTLEVSELMFKVHMKYFGGEKVLMLMEPQEKEEALFRYENNGMIHLGGYYLYYEKNPPMQTYMIDKNKELQPEVQERYEDHAVKDFRKIITDKKESRKESAAPSVFSYGLTACLAIAVLTVGVNFYRNYQDMEKSGKESATVSSVIVEEITPSPVEQNEEDKNIQYKKQENHEENLLDEDADNALDDKRESSDTTVQDSAQKERGKESQDNEQSDDTNNEKNTSEIQASTQMTDAKNVGDTEKSDKTEQIPASKNQTSDKTEQIYQQESDDRKAQKRVREAAQKENSEAVSKTHESYVIQPGDTLYQICMDRYGNIEVLSQICQLNGMSADEIIYPGQIIVLP